jgi:two-component system, cell cycle response regulator DivK
VRRETAGAAAIRTAIAGGQRNCSPATNDVRRSLAPLDQGTGMTTPTTSASRVLIVEDNPLNAKLLRDVLRASGYDVLESTTAEVGIELARREHPDLILMDIQLPGMNGVAALRTLKQDPQTDRIPIIAVTASAMPQERSQILGAGFDGYQAKPIGVKALLTELAEILARRRDSGDG